MQQHLMQMQPKVAAYYPNNVTTDHIQQYLDENKSLILKIVESQNSGKLSECAENQARLQRNLMYLAAIADSQLQPPAQFPSSGIMQPGSGHYMQHQQAQPMMTQESLMASRSSMLYAQQPFSTLQQQCLNMLQNEASTGGGSGALRAGGFPGFGPCSSGECGRAMAGGSKQDTGNTVESAEARRGNSDDQCD